MFMSAACVCSAPLELGDMGIGIAPKTDPTDPSNPTDPFPIALLIVSSISANESRIFKGNFAAIAFIISERERRPPQ